MQALNSAAPTWSTAYLRVVVRPTLSCKSPRPSSSGSDNWCSAPEYSQPDGRTWQSTEKGGMQAPSAIGGFPGNEWGRLKLPSLLQHAGPNETLRITNRGACLAPTVVPGAPEALAFDR